MDSADEFLVKTITEIKENLKRLMDKHNLKYIDVAEEESK